MNFPDSPKIELAIFIELSSISPFLERMLTVTEFILRKNYDEKSLQSYAKLNFIMRKYINSSLKEPPVKILL